MTAAAVAVDRVPDGTRPLHVGRPVPFLESAIATEQARCFVDEWAERYGTSVPLHCRRTIEAGEHYLLHRELAGDGAPTGRTWSLCAPCAVVDAEAWDVREAGA